MGKTITGEVLRRKFIAAGIVPDMCRWLRITVPLDDPVTIEYECYGDHKLNTIQLPSRAED